MSAFRLKQSLPTRQTGQLHSVVRVFYVEGQPVVTRAYARRSPIGASERRRFLAVLQMGAIQSPLNAVRAAIVAEARGHGY